MRQTILHRVLVILFLVFALSDITSGELCNDELNGLNDACVSAVSTVSKNNLNINISIDASQTAHQESDDTHTHCTECFCCCTHILPSQVFVADAAIKEALPMDVPNCALPTSPSKDTFHPPRFA